MKMMLGGDTSSPAASPKRIEDPGPSPPLSESSTFEDVIRHPLGLNSFHQVNPRLTLRALVIGRPLTDRCALRSICAGSRHESKGS